MRYVENFVVALCITFILFCGCAFFWLFNESNKYMRVYRVSEKLSKEAINQTIINCKP